MKPIFLLHKFLVLEIL